MNQGFDTFDEAFLEDPIERIVGPGGTVNTGRNQRRADGTTDLALDWLAGVSGKVFLWLHYFDPHDIQVVPPREFLQQFPAPTGERPEQLRYVYDIEIQYMDEQIGRVLDALDAAGRLVTRLVDGRKMESGIHRIPWGGMGRDGARMGSGVYFCLLRTENFVQTRKMILAR